MLYKLWKKRLLHGLCGRIIMCKNILYLFYIFLSEFNVKFSVKNKYVKQRIKQQWPSLCPSHMHNTSFTPLILTLSNNYSCIPETSHLIQDKHFF